MEHENEQAFDGEEDVWVEHARSVFVEMSTKTRPQVSAFGCSSLVFVVSSKFCT